MAAMFYGDFKEGNEYLVDCWDGELIGLDTSNRVHTWITIDSIEYDWAGVTFDNVDGDEVRTMIYLNDLKWYIEDESAFNS